MAEARLSKSLKALQVQAWRARGLDRLSAFWNLAQAFADIGWAANAAECWGRAAALADDYRRYDEFISCSYEAAEWYRLAGFGSTAGVFFYQTIDAIGNPGRNDRETEFFARSVHGIADLVAGEWVLMPEYDPKSPDPKSPNVVALMNTRSGGIQFLSPEDWQQFGSLRRRTDRRSLAELLAVAHPMIDISASSFEDRSRRMQRAGMAETLHCRSIDILAPYETTRPVDSGLREQLARARQCHASNLLHQDRRKEASALLRDTCRHWLVQDELDDSQKIRLSGALEMLGNIGMHGGRVAGAVDYFDRATELLESIATKNGGLYLHTYTVRLVGLARRAGTPQEADEVLIRARHIAARISDLAELCTTDRTLMQNWTLKRPEYAFRWGLSAILAYIAQIARAGPADREPLLRRLGSLYDEVWGLAQRVRMTRAFIASLAWMAYSRHVADYVTDQLRRSESYAAPIAPPSELISLSPAGPADPCEGVLIAADIGDFWCFAYRDRSDRWDVLTGSGDLVRTMRAEFSRAGIDVTERYPVGPPHYELDALLENCLAPMTSCLPVNCRAAIMSRIINNREPVRIAVMPCGPLTQAIPWPFLPVDDDGESVHKRLIIDGAALSLLARSTPGAAGSPPDPPGPPAAIGALTTSAQSFDLLGVTHVHSAQALLEGISNGAHLVTHIAGHSRLRTIGARREVHVEFGRRAIFSVRDLERVHRVSPLVVLSSCMSASTGWVPGGDWGGMVTGFLNRGTTSAIATIWAIPEDAGTAALDRALVARHIASAADGPPDQATILRDLQLEFLRESRAPSESSPDEPAAIRTRHIVPYCCVVAADLS
ncbi:CHAT domain-containing protein [Nocardia sp. NPDC003345]